MTHASASRLRSAVDHAGRSLAQLADSAAGRAPAPGKWSAKQVLGHLIDSATINHQRFVRAAAGEGLVFETYDQDRFVDLQAPGGAPWKELLDLWRLLNLHIVRVMEGVPADVREHSHSVHNLHAIAFRPVPAEQAATLDYMMLDYVEHLLHHLRQIDPELVPEAWSA